MARTPSPSEVRHDEWALVAPSWTLLTAEAPQRPPRLRQVFTGWRWMARAGAPWRLLPNDLPPWADDERRPETLAGLHLLVVAILMLTRVVALRGQSA
jgi:transposase